MKIKYYGHSCFVLTSNTGTSIMTDPYGGIGFELPRLVVDGVTVSHGHFDHNNIGAITAHKVLNRAESDTLGDIQISAIKSFHDEVKGAKRGENLIFKFFIDGVTVCHLGDLGEPFTAELGSKIAPVDVLLIPVGGTYTLDGKQATAYVEYLRPKIVIPMHYKCRGLNLDIASPDSFLKAFSQNAIKKISDYEYEIDKNFRPDQFNIIFMERYQ